MDKTYTQIRYPKYFDTNISKFEELSISFDLNHFSDEMDLNKILKEKKNEKKKILKFENMRRIEYEKIQNENSISHSFKCLTSLRKEKNKMTLNNENDNINDKEKKKILYRANTIKNVLNTIKKKQNFLIKSPKKKNILKKRFKNKSIQKQTLTQNKSLVQEKKIDKEKIENFIKQLNERIKEREEEEKKKKMEKEKNDKMKNENIQKNLIEIEVNIKRIQKEEEKKKIEREKLLKLKKEKLEEEERKKKEIEKEKVNEYLNKLKIKLKNRIEEERKKKNEKENEERIKKERFQNILVEIELNRKQFNEEKERKLKEEEEIEKIEERKKIILERRLKEEERKLKEKERIKRIEENNKKETERLLELEKKIIEKKKEEEKKEIQLKQLFIKLERKRRRKEEENKRIKEIEKMQSKINILRNKIEIKKEEKLKYENLNEELKHEWRLEKINNLLNEFITLNDNENIEQKLEIVNEIGKYFKEENKYDKENNKNNIITIHNALINPDPLIHFIGILANEFKNYGIKSIIEKESSNLNLVENVFQLLLSKFSMKIKYEITIRNINLINQFKKAISKYFTFIKHFKNKIIDIFTLNRNDVFFINNDIENFKLILVILNRRDIDLNNFCTNDIIIKKKNLLESVKFYLDFFDNKYNRLTNNWERKNFKRGGEKYKPPYFWKGFALRVLNKFDNGDNTWLGNEGKENEWAIAYHGIGKGNEFNKLLNIIKENLKSGPGQLLEYLPNIREKKISQIGIGVYLAPDIKEAEKYSEETIVGQSRVKFIIMCRVNPKKIRESGNYPVHWIVDGNYDALRPYRILVKVIKWFS
jgi:hypothetical protein